MALAAALGIALASRSPSLAQTDPTNTIKVTTKEDETTPNDGKCSLREAIQNANDNAKTSPDCKAGSATERDAIYFALGKKARITLGSTLPDITDGARLTIDGRKAKIKVSGNDAVRVFGVEPGAVLALRNLTVADGNSSFRAGLRNDGGEVEVWNSTISGNSATYSGGGIDNDGTLTVTNSTISGNSADLGGRMYNPGSATLTNSNISGNSATNNGGGILLEFSTATLKNTIVANSTQGGNCSGIAGTIVDGGYNIEDDTSCGFDPNNNFLPSTDPKLASSLAKNGGPTKTIALLKGSPAINAIPTATNGCGTEITTDQRGVKRPKGSGCDIGAFER